MGTAQQRNFIATCPQDGRRLTRAATKSTPIEANNADTTKPTISPSNILGANGGDNTAINKQRNKPAECAHKKPNVKLKGSRAFAQSRLSAGLGH